MTDFKKTANRVSHDDAGPIISKLRRISGYKNG